jgi:hypothetical protein
MHKSIFSALVLAALGFLSLSPVRAQEATPATQSPESADHGLDADDVRVARPLAGAQEQTIEARPKKPFLLLPSFTVATQVQTGTYNSTGAANHNTVSTSLVAGRLGLDHSTRKSVFELEYLAAGRFTTEHDERNSAIQNLSFAETVSFGRWSVLVGDQFTYLSESTFGFGGLGSLSTLGISLGPAGGVSPGLAGLAPDQTIATSGEPRIGNGVVGQVDYKLNARSSLTFLGSREDLKFFTSQFQNSNNLAFRGGYNYRISERDQVGAFYQFDSYRYFAGRITFNTHRLQMTYARMLTGQLSLQLAAGPVIEVFHAPRHGPPTVASWASSAGLEYRHGYTSVGLQASRELTDGSGILTGAHTTQFGGNVTRTLNPKWQGTLLTGYAFNQSLSQTAANAISPHAWFITARADRIVGRDGTLSFFYELFKQSNLAPVCPPQACISLTHTFSAAYSWSGWSRQ